MSLARYAAKLAALLGSDGKVPVAGITGLGSAATANTTAFDAAGAAAAVLASSMQKASNLSDLASAGSARSNLGLPVYDSGWYSVVKDTSYVKTHGLGSNNLLILNYFSYDASNAAFCTYPSFHSNSHLYTSGCIYADINASTFTVRTGYVDVCGPSPYPNTDTARFGGIDHLTSGGLNGYYRTIAIRLG